MGLALTLPLLVGISVLTFLLLQLAPGDFLNQMAENPAISINAGFDRDHLPIGLQLLAPHFREDLLLRVAHVYQQVTDWHERAPHL